MVYVDWTVFSSSTRIAEVASDASFKETFTTFAGELAIMFATAFVAANDAFDISSGQFVLLAHDGRLDWRPVRTRPARAGTVVVRRTIAAARPGAAHWSIVHPAFRYSWHPPLRTAPIAGIRDHATRVLWRGRRPGRRARWGRSRLVDDQNGALLLRLPPGHYWRRHFHQSHTSLPINTACLSPPATTSIDSSPFLRTVT